MEKTVIRLYTYLLILSLFFVGCQPKSETTSPAYKDLTEAVYASGNVFPKNEYKVVANADGYLQQQSVNEGDVVKGNQLLFSLESLSQDARAEAAANIYRQAEANYADGSPILAELEAALRSARTKLENDSVNYFRYKALYEQNATSKADLERVELAYRTAKNDVSARQKALARTKSQLYVDLQNTRSNFRVNAREGDNYRIRSIEAARVYEVYKKVGELVRKGEAIALLGNPNEVYLQLAVDETDFSKLKEGQDVLIKMDAYGDKVFKAKVTKIYPKLNKVDQSFRVDADFVGESPLAYYGLTVEANIVISKNPKALTIPKAYLVGKDSVWIEEGKEKKKIKVLKGAENFELVEVKAGLTEKSVLVKE
ncbi:HlyD family efflux transporter periplasmic adaptor subunit [Runella sp. CRIBMP]|uniref:efflux RND transporter periplasmic adaptor subunit n=1 Tax=Runella sp. CRIBMP TaxID=2683261 RepID=UPI001412F6C5|nr:efflux RND transporter periplasmic adaptor subunit [Runella sp. CRIBMP]NBB22705.1 HlyD family efflux transporter periplasmic adaptor subunit [Runella sp. CRIBMP]